MSEARGKVEEQVRFAATSLHDLNTFLDSPIWKELVATAQETMDGLQQGLLTPMTSTEDALNKNFVIGRIHGIPFMTMLAETKREELKNAHDKLVKELKNAT